MHQQDTYYTCLRLDLEFLRNRRSTALPSSPFTPVKSADYDRPQAPTPTRLAPRWSVDMWSPDQDTPELETEDPPSPTSDYLVESPTLSMVSSPSTIQAHSSFSRSPPRFTEPSNFATSRSRSHSQPAAARLPSGSSQLSDSYPFHHHNQQLVPPALSSTDSSSVSTRSSGYTNPGSALVSMDYNHVHVASGDDDQQVGVGITSDDVVQLLEQDASPSSISASRAPVDRSQWTRSYSGSIHSLSSSVVNSRTSSVALSLSSKPSFDAVWRTLDERDEAGLTSEDETDDDPGIDEVDEEEEPVELPTSAMVIADEGRGIIVRADGVPIVQLRAEPGTTHLLIGSAATPNAVPSFLANTLPQICETLLALDVSANFLGALSPALTCCLNLEELNIASNPLRALPEFLGSITSLRVLIADATGINTLPEPLVALERLHTLSVRRNKMHSLPSWLCILPVLETLLVDGNPFQGPWKALVDPLLSRASPTTPLFSPVPSGAHINAQNSTTDGSETDTEDLSDCQIPDREINHFASPEDDTITPARMNLSRAATSPYPEESSPSSRAGGSLVRTNTTPNRAYNDQRRRPSVSNPSQGIFPPRQQDNPGRSADREIRRLKSAGELRDSLPPVRHRRPLTTTSGRPSVSQYVTSVSSTNLLATGSSPQPNELDVVVPKRFASLGVSGNPVRTSPAKPRPELSMSIWDTLPSDEEPPNPSTSSSLSQLRLPVKSPPGSPPERAKFSDPQLSSSGGRARKEEKEKTSRWGFLKKMSMGKMRPDTSIPRPQTSHGMSNMTSVAKSDIRPIQYVDPPHIDVRISTTGLLDPPTQQLLPQQPKPIDHIRKISKDAQKHLSPPPSTIITPSPDYLAPSFPHLPSRAMKRRSFLPIDITPLPTSNTSLCEVTTTEDNEDISDDARATPSPGPVRAEPIEHIQRREEERAREAYTRALRSVMAYLRDMHDLGLSQTNVMSMYGSPLDGANSAIGSRRPTIVESSRSMSDNSFSSSTSADSTGQLRSVDSRNGLRRSGSEPMTQSMFTMDSAGSGEERKSRDDKGKRARIVREIVETERTYVKGLQELVDIYVTPASAPVNVLTGTGKETVIPTSERKMVFGGLDSLFSFHKENFLPALEAAAAPLMRQSDAVAEADPDGKLSLNVARMVANSFVSHAAFMRMYSSYINNFDNAVQRVKHWMSDRTNTPNTMSPSSSTAQLVGLGISMSAISGPTMSTDTIASNSLTAQLTSSQKKRIKAYLKRCRMNPRHSQLNLEGYLLLPVQRIPRYRMMLEELVKSTSSPAGEFISDPIERALSEISSLATNMNEGKRDAESRRKLVQWQSRIRGKFPSPLVQPHRRLIMDGPLSLTRVVRKACVTFEVIDSHGDASTVQVDCLAPEMTPRALIGILCNDLLVLCRDASQGHEPNAPVDLWAVLRMQTVPQPASIVHGNALRLVDNKAVLYFDAPSTSDALNWYRAINLHIPASKT